MPNKFEFFTEAVGWIQIVLSPFLIGSILGFFIYKIWPNNAVLALAIILSVIGLIIDIYIANKKWKNGGTLNFLSNIDSAKDLEEKVI